MIPILPILLVVRLINSQDVDESRPGVCPRITINALCVLNATRSDCSKDSDCLQREQKCCQTICGGTLKCQKPITGNRPGCPAIDPLLNCIIFRQNCNSDRDCGQGKQCCFQPSCGTTCRNVIPLPPVYESRPGVCPLFLRTLLCIQNGSRSDCTGEDSDCSNPEQKCCPSECGSLRCKTPITGNRPGCPAIDPQLSCLIFRENCNSDSDCGQGKQCCFHPSCGTNCMNVTQPQWDPVCPPYIKDVKCKRFDRQCTTNDDCKNGGVCCSVECGTSCISPPDDDLPCKPFVCDLDCKFGFATDDTGCKICRCNQKHVCPLIGCIIDCPNGQEVDANGCPRCQCKTEHACPLIKCPKQCEFGFVFDENGCRTCDCKRNTCIPPPCAHPPPGVCFEQEYRMIDGIKCPWCFRIIPCEPKICPAEREDSICYDYTRDCQDDSSCTDGQKCCKKGCSYVCVNPV